VMALVVARMMAQVMAQVMIRVMVWVMVQAKGMALESDPGTGMEMKVARWVVVAPE
jgi:hypothetical protein